MVGIAAAGAACVVLGGCFGSAPTIADDSSTSTAGTAPTATGDASSATGEPMLDFFDDFQRDENTELGNGWLEKTPTAWAIDEDAVVAELIAAGNYYDQVVYRAELESDIEIRADFLIEAPNDSNEPHLIARLDPTAVAQGVPYTGYILVPQLSQDRLTLMRFNGVDGIDAQQATPWPSAELVPDRWYRLVMSVTGPGPIHLHGRLETQGETDGAWETIVEVDWDDVQGNPIGDAGFYGFSGGQYADLLGNFRFDNFGARVLDD